MNVVSASTQINEIHIFCFDLRGGRELSVFKHIEEKATDIHSPGLRDSIELSVFEDGAGCVSLVEAVDPLIQAVTVLHAGRDHICYRRQNATAG